MSSSSNDDNGAIDPSQPEPPIEWLSVSFASVMIGLSVLILVLNWRVSRWILSRKKHPKVKKLRRMLIKGRTAVKSGMLTPIELVILALEAGMTLEDVRLEYVNANGTREEVLASVFGTLDDENFFNRLTASGRFMETGYANEKVFLDLWKSESYRELVLTIQRTECPTQACEPSKVLDPMTSQAQNYFQPNADKVAIEPQGAQPPARPPADPKPKGSRRLMAETAILPEERPLLCSGKNDDAK